MAEYRKLPGRRRGFVNGSSVWLGTDHLLLVRSIRYREDYKRFHLRDIQAIIVAGAPRFVVSTPMAAVVVVWVLAYVVLASRAEWAPLVLWPAAAFLIGAWVYVSAACSCKCRIHTAVSRDDLASVYRTWIARRFMAAVEPRIAEFQGRAEVVPAEPAAEPTAVTRLDQPEGPAKPMAPRRNLVSDLFVASLFADALLNVLTLNSLTRGLQWVWYGLAFFEIAMAILIFLQYHRGELRAGMQRLAVGTLIVMGMAYYIRAAMSSLGWASNQLFPELVAPSSAPGYILLREIDAGVMLVLGCIGVGIGFWSSE